MNDSGDESSGGLWLVINFLGLCAIVAVVVPNFLPARTRCSANGCVNNLRQLDGAAQQWALENKKKPGDRITLTDILPYLKATPVCPQNGQYTIGPAVSNVPTCSIASHTLP